MALTAATAVAPIRARSSGETAGDGASSITFWWRRCTEQSRSPRWIALPWRSAKTWISMWRGSTIARSRITSSLPKALSASLLALRSASANEPASATSRMPRPPPPAVALIITGKPTLAASATSVASLWSSPW